MSEEDKGPWYGKVATVLATWLTGQNFNNILLLTIIVGGAYCLDRIVPAHLTQIQRGYEKEGQANREMIRTLDEAHREERKETRDLYDRWFQLSKKVAEQ